ncbi:hypothetical protein HDU93_007681 [Gonapodya sp. JEL0774]|nr:hypothetical protein HDU93_007681 [Gonapodya sp. JEL0774]
MASIPIIGWGMNFLEFIFVKFGNAAPPNSLVKALLKNIDPKLPLALLLFPEGTVLYPKNQVKSIEYLRKELKLADSATVSYPYTNVLLPKSAGLYSALTAPPDPPTEVWDFTVGYVGCRKPTSPAAGGSYPYDAIGPGAFWNGRQRVRKLVIHVRKFNVVDIPGVFDQDANDNTQRTSLESKGVADLSTQSPERLSRPLSMHSESLSSVPGVCQPPAAFTAWLRDRFLEKDALMEWFYIRGKFPDIDPVVEELRVVHPGQADGVQVPETLSSNAKGASYQNVQERNDSRLVIRLEPISTWDVLAVVVMPLAVVWDFAQEALGRSWMGRGWEITKIKKA